MTLVTSSSPARASASRRTLLVASASLVLLLTAKADDGNGQNTAITREQCFSITPFPEVTDCDSYEPPVTDFYANLDYNGRPEYTKCVQTRCACTGATTTTDFTPSGMYCNSSGWMETGVTFCNIYILCMKHFWSCINTAVMDRYNEGLPTDATETALIADILAHGSTPGQPFNETQTFLSCRMHTCAGANSRQNCGLITCLPNYTQCDEYMKPPPVPYVHELCTQGCRAVLVMMAMTLAVVAFSIFCFACCPAQVRVIEPLIRDVSDEEDEGKKKKKRGPDDLTTPMTSSHEPSEEGDAGDASAAADEAKKKN